MIPERIQPKIDTLHRRITEVLHEFHPDPHRRRVIADLIDAALDITWELVNHLIPEPDDLPQTHGPRPNKPSPPDGS